mmetsp:Transcript_122933/g.342570  ORF Transcript_122933/g.342570 Transcript_122933/m.342570 type:complete len:246 (-) Transcript_122933:119-856(-)
MPSHPQGLGPQSLWQTPAFSWWNANLTEVNRRLVVHIHGLAAGNTSHSIGPLTPGLQWRSGSSKFLSECMRVGGIVARAAGTLHNFLQVSVLKYLRATLISKDRGVLERLAVIIEGSWASMSVHGTCQAPHVHSTAGLSGTYYLECGAAIEEGKGTSKCIIALEDPRTPAATSDMPRVLRQRLGFGAPKTFQLQPGSVLVYPSWLVHAAMPIQGAGRRTAISFVASITLRAPVEPSGTIGDAEEL